MLDLYTFGKWPADITLAEILEKLNNKKLTRKISIMISHFDKLINHIKVLKDDDVKTNLHYILGREYEFKMKELEDKFPNEKSNVFNFVRNHIKTKLKLDLHPDFRK